MIIYHTHEFLSTLTTVIDTYLQYFIQNTQVALQNKVEGKEEKKNKQKTKPQNPIHTQTVTLSYCSCGFIVMLI